MTTERLTVYSDRIRGTIAPEVYGHFIEHLGHCIYDGIWVGKDSSIPNIGGIRKEAVDVFRAVAAPLIRWPGGYFADCYDWRDGVGPARKRPIRFHECEADKEETNAFGTHEFMQFCELTGAKPNLCVNTATLTAQDAMNWVEYCNADGRTSFAQQRRKNGKADPWHVEYWAIGNESYWLHRPQDYVQRYLLWRKYMRRVSPGIKCIASLVEPTWNPKPFSPHNDWLQEVIAGIRENMELASLHLYSGCGTADTFTTQEYWGELAQIDQRNRLRIESFLGSIDSIVGSQHVKLALDEWGLWHAGATMTNNCEQPCTHRDALFAARYFHLLQRYPGRIGLATIAQSVGVLHALLRTDGPRTYRTPTFYVFEMFKGHQGGHAVESLHTTPQMAIESPETVLTTDKSLDVVTASVSLSPDRQQMLITFTNADLEKAFTYDIDVVGSLVPASGTSRVLTADPRAQNTFEEPERVKARKHPVVFSDGRLSVQLPPCSIVSICLAGTENEIHAPTKKSSERRETRRR
jgi:alpha-L-arabinofuranosidase